MAEQASVPDLACQNSISLRGLLGGAKRCCLKGRTPLGGAAVSHMTSEDMWSGAPLSGAVIVSHTTKGPAGNTSHYNVGPTAVFDLISGQSLSPKSDTRVELLCGIAGGNKTCLGLAKTV